MEVLRPEVPNKFLITAVVNGLVATSIIWVFWTPFLFFIAAPLMNAIIKSQICYGATHIPALLKGLINSEAEAKAFDIFEDNVPTPAITGENLVLQNKQVYTADNVQIFLLFWIISIIVIISTLVLARYLIIWNGLNMREIVVFNLIMAGIIMFIEMVFFAGVTTQYIPFNIEDLVAKLAEKINDTLTPLTFPITYGPNAN
jgi:hypothetical protein